MNRLWRFPARRIGIERRAMARSRLRVAGFPSACGRGALLPVSTLATSALLPKNVPITFLRSNQKRHYQHQKDQAPEKPVQVAENQDASGNDKADDRHGKGYRPDDRVRRFASHDSYGNLPPVPSDAKACCGTRR